MENKDIKNLIKKKSEEAYKIGKNVGVMMVVDKVINWLDKQPNYLDNEEELRAFLKSLLNQ